MTVSAHKATAKGSGGVDDGRNSGVILNAGTPDSTQAWMNSSTTAKTPLEIVKGVKRYGAVVLASTGTTNHPGVEKANSSGLLAYNPSASVAKRAINFASAPDSGFIIKQGVVNKVAGTSLNPILSGSYKESLATGSVHVPNGIHKYKRLGAWSSYVLDAFGTKAAGVLLQNEDGSDLTAKSGLSTRGASISLATDHAAFGHVSSARAVGASELVILFNFVDWDKSSSPNLVDYSTITG